MSSQDAAFPAPRETDADLAAALCAGDPAARVRLAEAWGPRIYRYLARRLDDRETVRDLTQETLTRALGAIRQGTRPRDLTAWLFRIATNLLREEYRSRRRSRVTPAGAPDGPGGDDPQQAVIDALRREAVRQAVLHLPAELQEVLVLRYYEGFSVEQIAGIVGIPAGTVKSRLFRAYRRLERELAPWRRGSDRGGNAHGG